VEEKEQKRFRKPKKDRRRARNSGREHTQTHTHNHTHISILAPAHTHLDQEVLEFLVSYSQQLSFALTRSFSPFFGLSHSLASTLAGNYFMFFLILDHIFRITGEKELRVREYDNGQD